MNPARTDDQQGKQEKAEAFCLRWTGRIEGGKRWEENGVERIEEVGGDSSCIRVLVGDRMHGRAGTMCNPCCFGLLAWGEREGAVCIAKHCRRKSDRFVS